VDILEQVPYPRHSPLNPIPKTPKAHLHQSYQDSFYHCHTIAGSRNKLYPDALFDGENQLKMSNFVIAKHDQPLHSDKS
jgi:hypothetical protein